VRPHGAAGPVELTSPIHLLLALATIDTAGAAEPNRTHCIELDC